MERQITSQVQQAAEAALSRNATDPVALDVSGRLALTDAFLIVSGSSERNVGAIADAVDERLGAIGVHMKRREGTRLRALGAARLRRRGRARLPRGGPRVLRARAALARLPRHPHRADGARLLAVGLLAARARYSVMDMPYRRRNARAR